MGQDLKKTGMYLVRKEKNDNEIFFPTLGLVSCFIF